jgi:tetratricopeptide (TPR) repeat protein
VITLALEGSFDSAIPYAEKALFLDRTMSAAANALAISHYGLGNYEKANRYVELSAKLGGDSEVLMEIFQRIDNGTFPFE